VTQKRRPAAVSCLQCHLAGMRRASLDTVLPNDSPAWALRELTNGLTCVSCHTTVGADHLRAPSASPPSAAAASGRCIDCHDIVNSPQFTRDTYVPRLGCVIARNTVTGGNKR
jgi:predicted CxxxxCH...CXXCH cytochrome family protein